MGYRGRQIKVTRSLWTIRHTQCLASMSRQRLAVTSTGAAPVARLSGYPPSLFLLVFAGLRLIAGLRVEGRKVV